MTRKVVSPLLIGVVCGMGTVLAMSVLAMVLAPGLPMALYDLGAISRAINVGDWLPPVFALVSLVGYVEAGFVYMLFKRRQAASAPSITLVDVVGQDPPATARPPAVSGAIAGALSALLALGLALPILVTLTYVTLLNRDMNMPPPIMTQLLVGSGILGVVNLITGVILGAVLGALGGVLGSMLPQTTPTTQVS